MVHRGRILVAETIPMLSVVVSTAFTMMMFVFIDFTTRQRKHRGDTQ